MSSQRNTVAVIAACSAICLLNTDRVQAQFASENISMHSHLSLAEFGASFAEDCWGYVSPSGREYAILGVSTGTAFVEITNPVNPVIVDIMTQSNRGRDMRVYQDFVYSSSDSGPTHVYDVSDIDNGNITFVRSINAGAHNLSLDETSGFLYLDVGGPMRIYDLTDPSNPTEVGIWSGQTHDAHIVTYIDGQYAGRQIAFVFAGWDGWLDIVDVTDKTNTFRVGQTSYPSPGYTHQGWLTADRHYLYLSDEVDSIPRTSIIDVSDLENPKFIRDFTTGEASTDHNLFVHNGFIYEANYSSGMHIFNTVDPENPVRVGFFDTHPENNNPNGSGAWGVYPFFPSGTVIVSDRSRGLFVLDPSEAIGSCFPDCVPNGALDLFDFLCFQDRFVGGEAYACDCDTSTGPLVCDLFDFLCFQGAFVGGCP